MYAWPYIHNMTYALSFGCKFPSSLAARFQNFEDCFSVPSQLRENFWSSKRNEICWHVGLSNDEISFGVNYTSFIDALRIMDENKTEGFLL